MENPRAWELQLQFLKNYSPLFTECGLLVAEAWGSHVCIPSGIAEMKHVDTILAETHLVSKTHTHTLIQAGYAREGLRWINLEVAGWVSTAGAAPPAQNWVGNLPARYT